MTNILSLFSIVGVFATAVNLICASTPSTVLQLLHMAGNM